MLLWSASGKLASQKCSAFWAAMQTYHQCVQQCTSALRKFRAEADYISVRFEGLWYISLMQMWLEYGIVGVLSRTSESEEFLRCNLLCLDERPSHNGPSPAYEVSVEQVCSLGGDYNGFTTDLTHSFTTPSPPATFTSQKYHSVCAAANCHQLCYRYVKQQGDRRL